MSKQVDELWQKHRSTREASHGDDWMSMVGFADAMKGFLWMSVDDELPDVGRLCAVYYTWDGKPCGHAIDHYAEMGNCPGKFKWGKEWGCQPIKVTRWMYISTPGVTE